MKILIIDDERVWAENIKAYTEAFFSRNGIKNHYTVVEKVNEEIDLGEFDIALLDIKLEEQSGLQIAQEIKEHNKYAVCIFVTSYPEFSMEGWRAKGFGYILKPFYREDIEETLKEAIIYLRGAKTVTKNSFIKINNKLSVKMDKIVSIEKLDRAIIIYTTQDKFKTYNFSLKTIKEKLNNSFIYINKNVIINIESVSSLEGDTVTLNGMGKKKVSETHIAEVKEQISSLLKRR